MKPTQQTRFTPEEGGNCVAACIASIFECPLESVPQLNGLEGLTDAGFAAYRARLDKWLASHNLTRLCFDVGRWVPTGYAILAVRSPRVPDCQHAVVALDGVVVWDPHPQHELVREQMPEQINWTVFQVINPSRPIGPF